MTPNALEDQTLDRHSSPVSLPANDRGLPGETPAGPTLEHPVSRRKRIAWIVGLIALVVAIAIGVHIRLANKASPFAHFGGGGPLPVSVARATTADVPVVIDALGTVTPLATVSVRPQVSGPLIDIAFKEGEMIHQGGLLAMIDPRPYQAALDQAQAQLERDQAALASARIDLARYKRLLAQNSVATQTYADQLGTVRQDQGTVAADKAAVETAAISLSYCRITSPVAGRVGLRQVDLGNLLQADQTTPIVTVTQMQPMSVLFSVPQVDLSSIFDQLGRGRTLEVEAYTQNMQHLIATGHLASADNQINTSTGTLEMRAMFNNSKMQLFPQEFVNVKLVVDELRNRVVIPGSAVQNGPSSNFVFIVNSNDTVTMRTVTTGPTFGQDITILSGLTPGETVVTDGADQLRTGAHVRIPGAEPASAPAT